MIALLTILFVFSPSSAIGATGHHGQDLTTMRDRSEQVIRGVVRTAESTMTHQGIVTEYVIDVEEVLYGTPIHMISLRLPGGKYQDLIERVSGVPIWQHGDEVVVFVPQTGPVSLTGMFTLFNEALVTEMPHLQTVFPRTIAEFEDQLHHFPVHQ